MQKVERQKHKDRKGLRPAWLILCALFLAACVGAALLLRNKAAEEPPKARERIRGAVTQRDTADVAQVTITRRGEAPWTLLQDPEGKLTLRRQEGSGSEEWAADENAAGMILDAAANLAYEDVFTDNREDWEPEAEAFGLKGNGGYEMESGELALLDSFGKALPLSIFVRLGR